MRAGAYGGARTPFLLVLPSLSLVRCFGTITLLVLLRLTASIRGLCVFSVAFISFSFLRSHLFCHVLHIHTSIHMYAHMQEFRTQPLRREKKNIKGTVRTARYPSPAVTERGRDVERLTTPYYYF